MGHYLLSPGKPQRINARYDASRTTNDNVEHWKNADFLAPDASNNCYVRSYLRARSRYEAVENNSYLKGIVLTLCNDYAGSGPKVVFTDRRISDTVRKNLERRFNEEYAEQIKLRDLLWRLRHAKCVDGEGFAVQYTDRQIPETEVRSAWSVFEAEQCQMPHAHQLTDGYRIIDGIRIDNHGDPRAYFVYYSHPNDIHYNTNMMYDGMIRGRWVPKRYIIHWTRKERPWQRGTPETVAALPLCAYLRRYTLAVLASAETAANFAGVLHSTQPAMPGGLVFNATGGDYMDDDWSPFETFPIERGMFTNLPKDYELTQLKAEQPTENHDRFIDSMMREIARSMQMPFNVAVGFSGGYNMASGTLDRQLYNGALRQEHMESEDHVLRKIVSEWWYEGQRITGYFDEGTREFTRPPKYKVRWDVQPEHADPSKVMSALALAWDKGFITDEELMVARFNIDPEDHYESLARQAARREAIGMPLPGVTQVQQNTNEGNTSDDDDDDNDTSEDSSEDVGETVENES